MPDASSCIVHAKIMSCFRYGLSPESVIHEHATVQISPHRGTLTWQSSVICGVAPRARARCRLIQVSLPSTCLLHHGNELPGLVRARLGRRYHRQL